MVKIVDFNELVKGISDRPADGTCFIASVYGNKSANVFVYGEKAVEKIKKWLKQPIYEDGRDALFRLDKPPVVAKSYMERILEITT